MSEEGVNHGRRRVLTWTTAVVGAVGAGFAAVPFVQSWQPSAKARLIGGPVEVNLAPLQPGQMMKAVWRGQTIGILRRTPEMLETLPEVRDRLRDPDSNEVDQQPEYAKNEGRSLRPEYLVANIHCTHLGCVPKLVPEVGPQPFDSEWKGGFFCPCHKSRFDLSGRVYQGVPAQLNLLIPPYSYASDDTLVLGIDPAEGAA
ncbi:MAG: ubiquinol-cytochrome c reductase iron-sulfur subunit [Xanthomonadales bacterium]|jgi:ubiquinol-cytochrome c reductase iron-sulfur subunit|nr:ubiquinol-cytochrome c reductase iron-sulfur subunit [Xanthomonadales bacterium]